MERDIITTLIEWKDQKNRKPLIIEGARQVGKTWLVKEFGKRCFSDVVYLNFDRDHSLCEIFKSDITPVSILSAISVFFEKKIHPESTLIIFDEVQEEPRALTSLKYFCEDASEYHIIATGSFMGIALHEGTSFPVGKVRILRMYPLTFCEFLKALGREKLADVTMSQDMDALLPFKDTLIGYLKTYYVVGGMPEAVKSYVDDGNLYAVRAIQESICDLYRQDFSKHAPISQVPRLNQVWDSVPSQLAKENRKFIYGLIAKGARAKDFELAIMWLRDCGLIHMVHRIKKPGIPLKAYTDMSSFKIYLNDIGLLGAMAQLDPKATLIGNSVFTEFKGAMTEQFVLQQLIYEGYEAYYYSAENSRGEIDFLIQRGDSVIPIEVKAEENLQAKSLRAFTQKFDIPGVRISMSDYREQDWLTNYPLYAFTGWFTMM